MPSNRVDLQVLLVQRDSLRYSPAGIPILAAVLAHSSEQAEAGATRKVELELPAVFAGRAAQATPAQLEMEVEGYVDQSGKKSELL